MFCPKCGKQLNDNVAFCPECGNKIGAAIPVDQPEPTPVNDVVPESEPAPVVTDEPAQPVLNDDVTVQPEPAKKKKSGKFIALLVAIIIAGLLVLFGGFILIDKFVLDGAVLGDVFGYGYTVVADDDDDDDKDASSTQPSSSDGLTAQPVSDLTAESLKGRWSTTVNFVDLFNALESNSSDDFAILDGMLDLFGNTTAQLDFMFDFDGSTVRMIADEKAITDAYQNLMQDFIATLSSDNAIYEFIASIAGCTADEAKDLLEQQGYSAADYLNELKSELNAVDYSEITAEMPRTADGYVLLGDESDVTSYTVNKGVITFTSSDGSVSSLTVDFSSTSLHVTATTGDGMNVFLNKTLSKVTSF